MNALSISAAALLTLGIAVFGGMMPLVQAVTSAGWLALVAAQQVGRARKGRSLRWSPAALLLVGFAAWTLLRAGPLGAGFAGELERAAHGVWDGLPVRGTMTPGAAPLRAFTLLGLAAAVQFWSSTSARAEEATRRVAIVALATVPLLGLVHGFLNVELVYGFHAPRHGGVLFNPFAAPFVSPNQAGAAIMLLAVLALYRARITIHRQERVPLVLAALVAAGYIAIVLEARSAAFGVLAAVVVMGVSLAPDRAWTRGRARAATLGVFALWVLTAVLMWGVAASIDDAWASKAQRWQEIWGLVAQRPVFGWGAGALGDVSAAHFGEVYRVRRELSESVPIGVAFEYGVPAMLLVLAATAWLVWRNVAEGKLDSLWIRFAELGVATAVVIEAMGGMGFASTGYAAIVAAIASPWIRRSRKRKPTSTDLVGPVAVVAVVLASLPNLGASVAYGGTEVQRPLEAAAAEHGWASDEVDAEAMRLARLVPGSPRLLRAWGIAGIRRADASLASAPARYLEERLSGWRLTWDVVFDVRMLEGDREAACVVIGRLASVDRIRPPVLAAAMLSWSGSDIRSVAPCLGDETESWGAAYEALRVTGESTRLLTLAAHRSETHPAELVTLRTLARGYQALDVHYFAREAAASAASAASATASDLLVLARSEAELGDTRAAWTALERALRLDPASCDVLSARVRFAERYEEQVATSALRDDVESARSVCAGHNADLLRVSRSAARSLYARGDLVGAEEQAFRWLSKEADAPEALRLLGQISEDQGRHSRATGFFVRAAQAEERGERR